ncbi:MAG: hypothetical protein GWO07_05570 [Candidatus Dadabacteria bacterium]|nr:hypothetical protein [Candidatus Dadabacteria bacterium]NIS08223.1 hypothetical protein [Candidatus Dadabacteria bacterium]NIV41490.1 hypothetical protein [Candidatus Dadabacteria bacterium]NIY21711.1 hypothetical protein [Candidatus Dadabacteria bacterium]
MAKKLFLSLFSYKPPRYLVKVFSVIFLTVLLNTNISVLEENSQSKVNNKPIITVLEENTDFLMSTKGVVGIAQGLCEGKDCIKVYVVKKTAEILEEVPKSLDGYKIEIVETDVIKAR